MGFIFKTLFYLVLVFVGAAFLVNYFPDLKTRALETINPAFKEDRLLAQLGTSLGQLELNIQNAVSAQTPAEAKTQLAASQKIVEEAKVALQEASTINKKQTESSLTSQALSKVVEIFVEKTPLGNNPSPNPSSPTVTTTNAGNSNPTQTCRP